MLFITLLSVTKYLLQSIRSVMFVTDRALLIFSVFLKPSNTLPLLLFSSLISSILCFQKYGLYCLQAAVDLWTKTLQKVIIVFRCYFKEN